MSDQFLELELRLIILRNGRKRVLSVFARLTDQTEEEFERQLLAAEQKTKAKKPRMSMMELIANCGRERPDAVEPMRTLATRFENRTFLPHLRDVQRFLDRVDPSKGKIKSRELAAPILMQALAKLSREDLIQLAATVQTPGESDYSMLARAIMGTSSGRPSALSESGNKAPKE